MKRNSLSELHSIRGFVGAFGVHRSGFLIAQNWALAPLGEVRAAGATLFVLLDAARTQLPKCRSFSCRFGDGLLVTVEREGTMVCALVSLQHDSDRLDIALRIAAAELSDQFTVRSSFFPHSDRFSLP